MGLTEYPLNVVEDGLLFRGTGCPFCRPSRSSSSATLSSRITCFGFLRGISSSRQSILALTQVMQGRIASWHLLASAEHISYDYRCGQKAALGLQFPLPACYTSMSPRQGDPWFLPRAFSVFSIELVLRAQRGLCICL